MSKYQGLLKTNDALAVSMVLGYETGLDYKKLSLMNVAEKTSYQLLGKLVQPLLNDFAPTFLKNEGDFLYYKANQEHLTTGLIAGIYTYYGKNQSFNKSIMEGAINGTSSYIAEKLVKKLGENPDLKLKDDILF